MARSPIKNFFKIVDFIGGNGTRLLREEGSCSSLRGLQGSKSDGSDGEFKATKGDDSLGNNSAIHDSGVSGNKYNSRLLSYRKPDITWLSKALEPALQLYKWAIPAGNSIGNEPAPVDRSLSEIFASIRRSKLGIKDWSLSDLTIGLYLLYLRQASAEVADDVTGEMVSSEPIIQDLIYHVELAKGAYKDSVAGLARNSMLRKNNIVKFINNSNVLRPGYYLGVDVRKKLVILGIRGTQSVYDLITDVITSGSREEITFEGYSAHFGTAEAARWFVSHEIDSIRRCLKDHKGFRLRIVGHSMGGATASLLAIMLRKKSPLELGFSPDIITAVGVATPPCVSMELAQHCSDFVSTVVMQDDIIPRLSIASLKRLREEIVETDWVSAFKSEDWKRVMDLVTNAKQVVSSVQEVAQKLAEYAQFKEERKHPETPVKEEVSVASNLSHESLLPDNIADELFVPGTLYNLKRNSNAKNVESAVEYFTLLRKQPGEHSQRILLSSNIISDHKCDSHYYALRDVLKGLPTCSNESIFSNE
ncbi:uncharacterized protein LOC127259022 isoform X2 [Andrographis paniculata]|uniref:uncharacterized protein LOC127259022 isoform X2 n=1 Tax=Andrographis paniculata TaxID=175694 RepID=UPI0021E99B1F|nr:uncharacterized protein LOC127259022 isoform X2 [Andrographis paniculata]